MYVSRRVRSACSASGHTVRKVAPPNGIAARSAYATESLTLSGQSFKVVVVVVELDVEEVEEVERVSRVEATSSSPHFK
jgi:hypothetical protein